ncbi:CHAT domain-containing protein [Streptomyces sp. NEAU-NA10]|uniref:CHAT domain-containing protein n=1 Tax=Streptomyces sp. NEAU-NA10 TaxID=3416050 RepID=UPI003CC593E3
MNEVWAHMAAAASETELETVLSGLGDDTAPTRHLLDLADRLEEMFSPSAMITVLELAVRAARAAGAEELAATARLRRDALLSAMDLDRRHSDKALERVDETAAALDAVGEPLRAADARLHAAVSLAERGLIDDSSLRAHRVMDTLQSVPGALAQAGQSTMAAPLLPGSLAVPRLLVLAGTLSNAPCPRPSGAVAIARMHKMLRESGWEDLSTACAHHLGVLLARLGAPESALSVLRDHLAVRPRSAEGAAVLARARFWYAVSLQRTGRSDSALSKFHWLSSDREPELRSRVKAQAASLLISEGEPAEALNVLSEEPRSSMLMRSLRALAEASLHVPVHASDLGEEGPHDPDDVHWARLTWVHAVALSDPAAAQFPDISPDDLGDRGLVAVWHRVRGEVCMAHGDAAGALKHFTAALEEVLTPVEVKGWREMWSGLPDTVADRLVRLSTERAIRTGSGLGADLWLRCAAAQEALGQDPSQSLSRALEAASVRNNHAVSFAALLASARWNERAGLPRWRADLERAADLIEGLRDRLRDEQLRLYALPEQDMVYAQLLEAALADGDLNEALRVLERAKARTLFDQAEAGGPGLQRLGAAEAGEAEALRGRIIRALHRGFGRPWESSEVEALTRRLASLYRGRQRRPLGARAAATPREAVEAATDGTAVLHYFCGPDRITLVVVVDQVARQVRLDITPQDVRDHLEVWDAERRIRATPHSLAALYEGLIAPAEGLLAAMRRLLVVPHGVLHAVPFAALRGCSGYLIEHRTVVLAPSTAVAVRAGRRLGERPDGAGSCALGLESVSYLPLPALPCVPEELDALERVLPRLERLERGRADRRALLSLDGPVDVLHFACHAEFDARDPLLSRFYLSDGPVYGYELADLRVRPRLVVFSACETALAERLPGDEMLGLIRPFLSLGAGAVVAALWEVPDASTTALMASFYDAYARDPHDPAAALRAGQLALLASPRFSHPHYWGSYVAIGGTGER